MKFSFDVFQKKHDCKIMISAMHMRIDLMESMIISAGIVEEIFSIRWRIAEILCSISPESYLKTVFFELKWNKKRYLKFRFDNTRRIYKHRNWCIVFVYNIHGLAKIMFFVHNKGNFWSSIIPLQFRYIVTNLFQMVENFLSFKMIYNLR